MSGTRSLQVLGALFSVGELDGDSEGATGVMLASSSERPATLEEYLAILGETGPVEVDEDRCGGGIVELKDGAETIAVFVPAFLEPDDVLRELRPRFGARTQFRMCDGP